MQNSEKTEHNKLIQGISNCYKIASLILIVIVSVFFISDLFQTTPTIAEYKFPILEENENNGINNKELRNMLLDEIQYIYNSASSLKGKVPEIEKVKNFFNIEVSGVKSNYNQIVEYIQHKIGINRKVFSVSVTRINHQFCSRLRLNEVLLSKSCIQFLDSNKNEAKAFLDSILRNQALTIVQNIDSYILSMYYFKNNDFKQSLSLSLYALDNQKESRKFALGTIANCYREVNENEKALEYYEKSIAEYPSFYPTIWQYCEFRRRTSEFDKAEELANIVIKNDLEMKRSALVSLLKIYIKTENGTKFSDIKNQYIKNYGTDAYDKLNLKKTTDNKRVCKNIRKIKN